MSTTLTRPGTDRSVLVQFAAAQMKAIQALVLGDDITCSERVELAAALRAAQRPTITWSEPEPGLHVIHAPGHVVRIYSDLIGLAAARADGSAWPTQRQGGRLRVAGGQVPGRGSAGRLDPCSRLPEALV